MFNIGFTELVVLGVLGLLVLGPDQLPEMAKKLARGLNELKRAAEDAMSPFNDIKRQALDAAEQAREQARLAAEAALKQPPEKKSEDTDEPG